MKIIHIASGKPYQLTPDTAIEIERPNPFFNTYGEQSLPLNIPASEYNRALLSYQEDLAATIKQQANIDAAIIDKDFYMVCRQAILSSKKKENISTSFYLNEGSFYTKLSDLNLKDVFGTESIHGVTTVEEGIAFCRTLISGNNPNYAIFPVLIDYSEVDGTNFTRRINYFQSKGYKFLNRWGYFSNDIFVDAPSDNSDFYNAKSRTEKVGDDTVALGPGYYITPFIRANYLLQRIFTYLGYTLKDNFFTKTLPFTNMVFVNNTMDSLVNGDIRIADLVPNCKISVILDLFRKKFCCEFIPDEVSKTMDIELFNDIMATDSGIDITTYATSEPEITFPEKYMAVKISSEDKVTDSSSASDVSSLSVLESKYPHSVIDPNDSNWYRYGKDDLTGVSDKTKTMECNEGYYQDSNFKEYEISVPDKSPITKASPNGYPIFSAIYIGESQALNSVLSNTDSSSSESSSSSSDQKPMLAFYHNRDNYPLGLCANYYNGTKLFDYTLYYNGPDGIFEKFYRVFDNFIRNSKHSVKVSLLLPAELKMNIKAQKLLLYHGQKLFIDTLKFNIGGKESPVESQFYTTKNHTPTVIAKTYNEIIAVDEPGYSWTTKNSVTEATQSDYMDNRTTKMKTIYPPAATSKYIPGVHYFEQFYVTETLTSDPNDRENREYSYEKHNFWWEVIKG